MVGGIEMMRMMMAVGILLITFVEEEILEEIIFVINGIPTTKLDFLEKYEKSKDHWDLLKRSGIKTEKFPSKQDFAGSMVEEILVQQEVDSQSIKVRDEDVINNIRTSMMEPQKISSMEEFKTALAVQGLEWEYFFEEHRKRMYQNFFLEKIVVTKEATREELEKFYKTKKEEFVIRKKLLQVSKVFIRIPSGVNFSEIAKIHNQAKSLREQIILGKKKFEQVAKEYSQDFLSGGEGDHSRWVGEDDFAPMDKRWKSIKSCKKGEISEVVDLSDGFAFFKVEGILTSGKMPFDRAKNMIRYKLKELAAMDAYKEKIKELRLKSTVKVYTEMFGKDFSL